jgi:Tfp pilus assembly protein PilF
MNRIEKLEEYLRATPEDSFLLHALALECIKIGEEQRARTLFESVLQRDPEYVGSYYHLAKLLERTGLPAEAIPVYRKGIDVARKLNDRHSQNELQLALDELTDD